MCGSVWVHPRYRITRNMKMHVSSIPPIMIHLSWVARLSMIRITVLDRPSMFATSSIFLWVPWCHKQMTQRIISNCTTHRFTSHYQKGTHLERRPLISEPIENTATAAQQVVHASVCVVQIGVELQGLVDGDGCVSVLWKL